ncbi:MAG: ABC-ATPase domain-containing protein [Spirochaetaceae bacterium]|nr:ABC-ATPase domain-containing protein [Spirochaetaceae bacterium]
MNPLSSLGPRLKGIDGKDYGAYQSLKGSYNSDNFVLYIDQIPKDPYAPSFTGIYRIRIEPSYSYIPEDLQENPIRKRAYEDFLARCFFRESSHCSSHRGTGNSGLITIDKPGQAILNRNSVILTDEFIELRFFMGLPANDRLINGELAQTMLFVELPDIIKKTFKKENIDTQDCDMHLKTSQTSEYLRSQLKEHGLICFIANRSLLPRKSGTSELPMEREKAVEFTSPESMEVRITLPDGNKISGMGIPEGISLIVGGGYHGKSTLLQTIAAGIYNHIPGDGRELAVTCKNALKLRAYSGRFVEKVDISPFINHLPSGDNTSVFSTENASGSTSQAAALMEGLEAETDLLLMDEDTCASNFMIRDYNMQQLVMKNDEPITPFIDRARQLFSRKNVSSILVLGGSGDYFEISDKVIQMKNYRPIDVTERAKQIAASSKTGRLIEFDDCDFTIKRRIPLRGSIDPENQYGKKSVYAKEVYRINFGRHIIDLTDVEQLSELSQTKAIMEALQRLNTYVDGKKSLIHILSFLQEKIENEGLDCLSDRISGNLAEFRMIDLACALNRLRSLKIAQ